jgi:uncharacterized BrkB/YihY/UPF0761 family membrane protein
MQRDHHDILGGLAMAAIGGAVALYSLANYDFGTLRQMGPGFFPTSLGTILAVLGLLITIPAWTRAGTPQSFALPETVAILSAILLFGFGLERLGLILTTAGAVLIASLPAPRKGWLWRLVLAVVVTAVTWIIFKLGLNMTMPLWPWA